MDNSLFTADERAYLKQLRENNRWLTILEKLLDFSQIPRYHTGKSENAQVSDWIYESGRLTATESLLSLLLVLTDEFEQKPKIGDIHGYIRGRRTASSAGD